MVLLKRLAAIYLIAVALAVALNWLATPIYHDGSANYPIWEILNWFMAVSFPLMLLVNAWRRYEFSLRDRDRTVTREYLETNVALAASVVLNLWFFWNWFGSLFPGRRVRGGSLGPPGVVGLHQPAGRTVARLYRGLPLALRLRQTGSADAV